MGRVLHLAGTLSVMPAIEDAWSTIIWAFLAKTADAHFMKVRRLWS